MSSAIASRGGGEREFVHCVSCLTRDGLGALERTGILSACAKPVPVSFASLRARVWPCPSHRCLPATSKQTSSSGRQCTARDRESASHAPYIPAESASVSQLVTQLGLCAHCVLYRCSASTTVDAPGRQAEHGGMFNALGGKPGAAHSRKQRHVCVHRFIRLALPVAQGHTGGGRRRRFPLELS
jgi:hypothetical protein